LSLALLDQVVFERQRLALVVHRDVFHIDGLAHQRSGLRVGLAGLQKIRPHPRAQILRLADVDHLAFGVLVEVAAWQGGDSADFLKQIHLVLSVLVR
jgi:hypothetical protein